MGARTGAQMPLRSMFQQPDYRGIQVSDSMTYINILYQVALERLKKTHPNTSYPAVRMVTWQAGHLQFLSLFH